MREVPTESRRRPRGRLRSMTRSGLALSAAITFTAGLSGVAGAAALTQAPYQGHVTSNTYSAQAGSGPMALP